MDRMSRVIYGLLVVSLLGVLLIGINQIFVTDYVFRTVLINHEKQMELVLDLTKRGLNQYLGSLKSDIETITDLDDIINFNENGKKIINRFHNKYSEIYSNVTRLNSEGKISYTVPYNDKVIGISVLYQPHNEKMYRTKKPVISAPFEAVQGYKAIAIAVPVFKNGKMDGSVSGLIPFNKLWELYVSRIQFSDNSVFFVCNDAGEIIYSKGIDSELSNINELYDDFKMPFDSMNSILNTPLQKVTLPFKENKEYLLVKDRFAINGNVWYLLSYTSINDLKKSESGTISVQRGFTYLIIILFVIISIIFIIHYNNREERNKREINKTKILSKLVSNEKDFLENILHQLLLSKHILIIMTEMTGKIVYISTSQKYISDNLFDSIEKDAKERIIKNLEFAEKCKGTFLSVFPLPTEVGKIEFVFNVSILQRQDGKFVVFTGFEYAENKLDYNTADSIHHIVNWYDDSSSRMIIDNKGKVILINRSAEKTSEC
ncbi:cache domain-containing protein, partial [candidate division WOR-3 bacterium]|nr:cache domain-containing protein [candidate division WOR-3 bacterium]